MLTACRCHGTAVSSTSDPPDPMTRHPTINFGALEQGLGLVCLEPERDIARCAHAHARGRPADRPGAYVVKIIM